MEDNTVTIPITTEYWHRSQLSGRAKWHRIHQLEAYDTTYNNGAHFTGAILSTVCHTSHHLTSGQSTTDRPTDNVCPRCLAWSERKDQEDACTL